MNNFYFKDIKKNTKKARDFIASHNYALDKNRNYDIFTFYKNPSCRKVASYNECRQMCNELNGNSFVITRGNCCYYSVAFLYTELNKNYLVYITASYNYRIEL